MPIKKFDFSVGKAIFWILGLIPLKAVRALGRLAGTITYHLALTRRKVALDNLDLAYGDALSQPEKLAIAKSSFINLVTTIVEFCYSPAIRCPMAELVELVNPDVFLKSYHEGKGIIVLVLHMGNWEVCGRWFGEQGIVQSAVVRRQKIAWVDRFVSFVRKTNRIIEIDKKNGLRKVLGALRRGEMVSMMIDQHAQREAVKVTFFGQPAMTHASPALLAMRTGCNVMVCSGFRHSDGSFGGVFSEPIKTTVSGNHEQDLIDNTQRYAAAMEVLVRRNPQDWMWMHRRWKTPKEGMAALPVVTTA
jgi:KDO2-lipid IV(A) lauroyltransferase